MKKLLTAAFLVLPLLDVVPARAASTTVVISEFRTRGPNGANDEFIELHNVTNSPVVIGGMRVSMSDSAGNRTALKTIAAGVTLQPGAFYLLINTSAQGYSGVTQGSATYQGSVPDDGGIALLTAASVIVDQVGMSAGSAFKEGTVLTPLSQNVNQSYERQFGGCQPNKDTDDNFADFRFNSSTSYPQNTSSVCTGCGGVSCNSPPNKQCWVFPGACDLGTCDYDPKVAGASCTDNNACTVGDSCNGSGTCVVGAADPCNTPPSAFCQDASTLVTYAATGTCAPATGCSYVSTPTACQFGCATTGGVSACEPDRCTGVSCTTPPNDCYQATGTCDNTTGQCQYAFMPSGTGCTDPDPCTENDQCNATGVCAGTPKVVDDNNVCTTDSCVAGAIVNAPVTDGTNCDDGNFCNGVATCQTGSCAPGTAVTCNTPSGQCYDTNGTCNPANGACTYAPKASTESCNDSDNCSAPDQCDGNGACVGAAVTCPLPAPACVAGDSRVATAGVCQASDGSCSFTYTTTPCSFGCDAGTGLCSGDPCIGVTCTTPPAGPCYEATGTCSGGTCSYALKAPGAACTDNDDCTSSDQCSAAGSCDGTPLNCNTPPLPTCNGAGDASTQYAAVGTCGGGNCSYTATTVPCAFGCDSNTGLCMGDPCGAVTCDTPPGQCYADVGQCSGGNCSYSAKQSGAACDDTDPCTDDTCDGSGACIGVVRACNTPPASVCESGSSRHYDAAGTCDSTGACQYTSSLVACTAGCDASTGLCNNDPCTGVVCNTSPGACYLGTGTCNASGTCDYGTQPAGTSCDDGDPLTANDVCDGLGACAGTSTPDGGATGGTGGSAGAAGSAGTAGTAGTAGSGGTAGSAGTAGTAGTAGSAGTAGTAGTGGSAGATGGTGGTGGSGGATGGSGGTGLVDGGATGGSGGGQVSAADDGGCGCSVPERTSDSPWLLALAGLGLAIARRRRH